MVASAYRVFELPWLDGQVDDLLLRKILASVLAFSLGLGLMVPFIPLPQEERQQVRALPPRLAQLVLEKQAPKPVKPKPKPIAPEIPKPVETPKPETKAVQKPIPQTKPAPDMEKPAQAQAQPHKPKVDRVAAARQKASTVGLLAFADELADLRDAPLSTSLQTAQPRVKVTSKTPAAPRTQRSVLTTGTQGSGGIDTSKISSGITGGTVLAARQTSTVESSLQVAVASAPATDSPSGPGKASRSYEEITLVMDKNKGAIFALYNRALRKDPTLQGKVVLEITIAADGSVSDCQVVSSELNDATLERKLVARIRLLNFGARDVETLVVTYPIDFLPA